MSEYIISSEQLERLIEGIEHDTRREINKVVCDGIELPGIVRCRDCAYYERENDDEGMCMFPDDNGDYARWMVDEDGFCYLGIRSVENA